MTTTRNADLMPGNHICFRPRGKRIFISEQQAPTPEDVILAVERTNLAVLAAAEEASPIRLAINMILQDGLSMAQACKSVNIKQYQLNRAIKRIAKRLCQEG